MARGRLWLLLCSAWALPQPVRAQPCAYDPTAMTFDGLDVRPGEGAEQVAVDAPIVVRYLDEVDLDALAASLADDLCAGELLCVLAEPGPRDDADAPRGQAERVEGRVQRIDAQTVAFVPRAALRPRTSHYALVARPGFDNAARGEIAFTTGQARDRQPPDLDVQRSQIEVAVSELPARCEAAPGSQRVTLAFPAASDDGDPGSVEHLVFRSRGGSGAGPALLARARTEDDRVRASFVLAPRDAARPLCLSLRAVDGVGRVSAQQPEVCLDPVSGSGFAPLCGAGGRPGPGAPTKPWPILLLSGLMLVLVARTRSHG